jgi:sodium/hydrogen antiporter
MGVDTYVVILIILGLSMLGMAWVPLLTKRLKISYSILYVVLGIAIYTAIDILPSPNPFGYLDFTVHITELVVIVSLMGTGLKIDEPFSFRDWKVPLRLVSITMLLNIGFVSLVAFYFLNLDVASSILLGAVLAPTDPVLAGDVQVGPPLEQKRSDVRFSLTAEAGLNDGMAFPFTWLAITLAVVPWSDATLFRWFYFDLLYRIIAGFLVGYLLGKAMAYLVFALPARRKLLVTRDGFVAFSTTLLVYGLTELISGYGFVAVFVCAVTLRNYELEHEFHIQLHSFTDQIERMLMAIVLVLFGGSMILDVFAEVTWQTVIFAAIIVLVIRPLTTAPSLIGTELHLKERVAVSFYGIRGIGSFFYLSFALQKADFSTANQLWTLVSVVVFLSIVVHGLTASSVMTWIESEFSRERKPSHKRNTEV